MAVHAALIREVEESAPGPEVAAFFDVDRTLLAGFSVLAFIRDAIWQGRMTAAEAMQTFGAIAQFQMGRLGFSGFVRGASSALREVLESDAMVESERIFSEYLAGDVYPESRALVEAHQRRGHTVAIVSSATRYQVAPLARDLGIEHVLCTELEVRDGRFTGDVLKPTVYGEGKALAARRLADRIPIDFDQSFFYTDSDEDLSLLEIVGKPRPTNPNRRLAEIARQRGWPVRQFTSRGMPGPVDVARTGAALWSLGPSVAAGAAAGVFAGSWRRAINLTVTTWGEFGSTLAGVDFAVQGEEHLWSHRPAVFIFNHQSAVDMLVLCKLLRRDFVGVAKQEIRRNPVFGPVFAFAGAVFVDRFDHAKAVEALQPAVDALREGLSLVIAPEGTRSPTPTPGPFKKGAFRMAMAAGVPIVPIVIRNALDALPKHGVVVRPTTIEVVVRPPVPTGDWTLGRLDEHIHEVRQMFLETLAS